MWRDWARYDVSAFRMSWQRSVWPDKTTQGRGGFGRPAIPEEKGTESRPSLAWQVSISRLQVGLSLACQHGAAHSESRNPR